MANSKPIDGPRVHPCLSACMSIMCYSFSPLRLLRDLLANVCQVSRTGVYPGV